MTLALLFATALSGPTVLKYEVPGSDVVAFEAVVALPEIGPRDELALRALCNVALKGTDEYSERTIVRYGSQTGRRVTYELAPGFVHVGLSMPRDQFATGLAMLDSLLRRAQLTKESLAEWTADPTGIEDDFWASACWPTATSARDLRYSDVTDAYKRYFRPENVTIAIGGDVNSAHVSRVQERFADWKAPPLRGSFFDAGRRTPRLKNRTKVSTFEVRSTEWKLKDGQVGERLAAAIALSVGKGASIFRVARDQMRLSYFQGGILWPSANGLCLRLIMARADPQADASLCDKLQAGLVADVDAWNNATLVRAKAVAHSAMTLDLGQFPITLHEAASLSGQLEDQTLLRCYWKSKTGVDWDGKAMDAAIQAVNLEGLKAAGRAWLQGSTTQAILGMGGR